LEKKRNLSWIKCKENIWCPLLTVNLADVETIGVYVIWHGRKGDQNARVVRLGQGDIADRLKAHRKDDEVLAYQDFGLYVTWAYVPEEDLDGVERHLADRWKPLVGEQFPDAEPIVVNSPWD
jgi:hypothetical protein